MKALQHACGIRTIKHQGALGHIFYMNDFLSLIAQEMANPLVRPHLHFLPEFAGSHLSATYQAR